MLDKECYFNNRMYTVHFADIWLAISLQKILSPGVPTWCPSCKLGDTAKLWGRSRTWNWTLRIPWSIIMSLYGLQVFRSELWRPALQGTKKWTISWRGPIKKVILLDAIQWQKRLKSAEWNGNEFEGRTKINIYLFSKYICKSLR